MFFVVVLEYLDNSELGNQGDRVGVNYCTVRRAVRLEVGALAKEKRRSHKRYPLEGFLSAAACSRAELFG